MIFLASVVVAFGFFVHLAPAVYLAGLGWGLVASTGTFIPELLREPSDTAA